MPLNSFKCESCGSRNNYVIELDDQGEQSVKCSSCGEITTISYAQLPERVRETIEDLEKDSKIFEDDQANLDALSSADTVDDTLNKVESTFEEARAEMNGFDHIVKFDGGIADIASEYISDDSFLKIKGYASAVVDEDGNLKSDWKRSGFETAVNEVNERLDGKDGMSARIVSYVHQTMQSDDGMNSLLDDDAMKAAGLGKTERFFLKKAAKSGKLAGILNEVLGEESF